MLPVFPKLGPVLEQLKDKIWQTKSLEFISCDLTWLVCYSLESRDFWIFTMYKEFFGQI